MAENPSDLLADGSQPLLAQLRRALSQLHERQATVETAVTALQLGQSQAVDAIVGQITQNFTDVLTKAHDLAAAIENGDFITANVVGAVSFASGATLTLTLAESTVFPFHPTSVLMLRRTSTASDYAFARAVSWVPETRQLTCTVFLAEGAAGPHDDVVVEIAALSTLAMSDMVDQAADAKDTAVSAKADAVEAAGVAGAAVTVSLGARDKASQWAENPEDEEVEAGKYSAKHHALKASASALAAAVFDPANFIAKAGDLMTGVLDFSTRGQTTARIRNRDSSNAFEWGHADQSGFQCVLGHENGSGWPFVAFYAEAGTDDNTYRSRGRKPRIIRADLTGNLQFGTLTNNNADNQSMTVTAYLDASGNWTATGYVAATDYKIGGVSIFAKANQWTKPQRVAPVALTSGTTITMNLADGNDRTLTLAHNATISNPADIATYVGQKGSIAGVQDGTGGRTLAMGNLWFPVGSSTMPAIPSGANAKWRIDYHVVSSTRIDFSVASVGV
jgi:hypothetical protein